MKSLIVQASNAGLILLRSSHKKERRAVLQQSILFHEGQLSRYHSVCSVRMDHIRCSLFSRSAHHTGYGSVVIFFINCFHRGYFSNMSIHTAVCNSSFWTKSVVRSVWKNTFVRRSKVGPSEGKKDWTLPITLFITYWRVNLQPPSPDHMFALV